MCNLCYTLQFHSDRDLVPKQPSSNNDDGIFSPWTENKLEWSMALKHIQLIVDHGFTLYSQSMTQIIVSVISAPAKIYSSYLIRPCSTGTALRPSHQHAWYGPECSERLGSVCGGEMF